MEVLRAWWITLVAGCSFRLAAGPDGGEVGGDGQGGSDARMSSGSDGALDAAAHAPTLEDEATGFGGGATVAATLAQAANLGDVELALVSWNSNVQLTSVIDTRRNTFTLLDTMVTTGSGSCALYVARVTNTTTPNQVTATFADNTGSLIEVAEYTGVTTSSPVDGHVLVLGTGVSASTSSVTTAHAPDVLVGLVAADAMPAAGAGYTQEAVTAFSLVEDRVAATPGGYTATATFGSGMAGWCITLAALEGR